MGSEQYDTITRIRQSAGDDIQTGRYTSIATAMGDLQAMGGAGNPIGIS